MSEQDVHSWFPSDQTEIGPDVPSDSGGLEHRGEPIIPVHPVIAEVDAPSGSTPNPSPPPPAPTEKSGD